MRKAKELRGLAVVDVTGGKKLGAVDDLVVSPDDGTLLAVTVSGGMFSGAKSYVRAEDIRSIGADAVTVVGENVARREDEMTEAVREAHRSSRTLLGAKVVTEGGALLGTVSDYLIDEASRRVTGLTIGGGLLSGQDGLAADRIVSVGPDAVIVSDESDDQAAAERRPRPWAAG